MMAASCRQNHVSQPPNLSSKSISGHKENEENTNNKK